MIGATAAQQLLRRRSVLLHTMVKIDDFWSKNNDEFLSYKKTLKSDQNASRYYSKASFHHFVDEKNYLNFLIYKSLIV